MENEETNFSSGFKRKRLISSKLTIEQKTKLIDLIEDTYKQQFPSYAKRKKLCWDEITREINALSPKCKKKTREQIRRCWTDIKTSLKKKLSKARSELPTVIPFTDTDERLIQIIDFNHLDSHAIEPGSDQHSFITGEITDQIKSEPNVESLPATLSESFQNFPELSETPPTHSRSPLQINNIPPQNITTEAVLFHNLKLQELVSEVKKMVENHNSFCKELIDIQKQNQNLLKQLLDKK